MTDPTDDEHDHSSADRSGPAPHVAALIDENLKLVYSDLVREDLPDRFKDLLTVLKAQDADRGANS